MTSVLILGYGYTASFLKPKLADLFPNAKIYTTSRRGGEHIEFDIERPDTWGNLPAVDVTFWTFPPESEQSTKAFYEHCGKQLGKLIVVGSTSAFKTESQDQNVDEKTPIDLSIPRVGAEDWLREQGAMVVYSAGIYGVGRNPLDWINRSYVGKSDKFVNMIHVSDLSQFLISAAQTGEAGARYIASDNNPMTWRSIIEQWQKDGLVGEVQVKASSRPSKRINCSESLKALQVNLEFPNFPKAVYSIVHGKN